MANAYRSALLGFFLVLAAAKARHRRRQLLPGQPQPLPQLPLPLNLPQLANHLPARNRRLPRLPAPRYLRLRRVTTRPVTPRRVTRSPGILASGRAARVSRSRARSPGNNRVSTPVITPPRTNTLPVTRPLRGTPPRSKGGATSLPLLSFVTKRGSLSRPGTPRVAHPQRTRHRRFRRPRRSPYFVDLDWGFEQGQCG